jgi:uncharacterized protein (TIGR02246 family)
MTPTTTQSAEASRIRALMENWADAVRNKDSKRLMAPVAPDVLVFDLITPLQYAGAQALKKRADEWLSSFDGPIAYEVRDLTITAGDEIAFCHSLNHVSGTTTAGQNIDMWWRATLCFRKQRGAWLIAHEHSSVPFDMKSGQAALNLQP